MPDQSFANSMDDYFNDLPVDTFVRKVLEIICADRAEGKTIEEIQKYLKELGVRVKIKEIKGVLSVYQRHTGEDLNFNGL